MEIARQEATVKMYTFRMNSEPENYAAITEEYKDAEEKLAKLYERWDAIAEDM
jgi:ATP-binding cassette subfamily F protein 3